MKILFVTVLVLFSHHAFPQEETTVFAGGEEGNKSYRIPAIVKSPDGSLLAFCEARRNGSGDFGDINIVLKISKDGGKRWGHFDRRRL